MRNTSKLWPWTLRLASAVGCLGFVSLWIGCAGAPVQPRPLPPSFRLAVLDFAVPAEWRNPQAPDKINKEMKGWWFGARDVWHNPGMGWMAGEVFANRLGKLPFVRMISRSDIKYYLASKRDLIRRKLDERRRKLEASVSPDDKLEALRIKNMTEADYDREIESLPPREIGRELSADRVLVGRIYNIYLARNRTVSWYWSAVDVEVDLVDVDTGKVVWHRRAPYKKNLSSTTLLLEAVADEMVRMMEREYFYQH